MPSSMTSAMRLSSVMPATVKVGSSIARASARPSIREQREKAVEALDCLALIGGILRRKAVKTADAEQLELGEMIAERARLRRAAARAGNGIPAVGRGLSGHACARIDVDHRAAGELRQVDAWNRRSRRAAPMEASDPRDGRAAAVVLRHRNLGGSTFGIVRARHRRSPASRR